MTDKDNKGQEFDIDQPGRSLKSTHGNASAGGYPIGQSPYRQAPPQTLTPADHFKFRSQPTEWYHKESSFYIDDPAKHFTRDVNDPALANEPVVHEEKIGDTTYQVPVFSGSTTNVNPFNNERMNQILTHGYGTWEEHEVTKDAADMDVRPPVSPIHPFYRTDPDVAKLANISTYNRTKLPIADLEYRKGLRHLFFTRPECYVMARNPSGMGAVLSEQAANDEDFASSYSRFPYISALLSPVYVTGSYSANGLNSNWNYLLSNRASGLQADGKVQISTDENMPASTEGYTVTIGKNLDSRLGGSLTIPFIDTKNLEVYEFLRLWVLYIYKIHKGIFAPSYNGYQYQNTFLNITGESLPVQNSVGSSNISPIILHPYDRALDYPCSLFDVVTNEAGTKIIYWCKYYGLYPTDVQVLGLSNENNGPLTDGMKISATFKYQYKLECVNKSLVEFNYNAGITDNVGRVTKAVEQSLPFLVRDDPNHLVMKQYIGAAGMFTGSPYIVMQDQEDSVTKKTTSHPYLRFMSINDTEVNKKMNLNITNYKTETSGIIGTSMETVSANVALDPGSVAPVEETISKASDLIDQINNITPDTSALVNHQVTADFVITNNQNADTLTADSTVGFSGGGKSRNVAEIS